MTDVICQECGAEQVVGILDDIECEECGSSALVAERERSEAT